MHGSGDNYSLEKMYETQTLWDEYMSESAANYIKIYPNSTLVVIAGLGHGENMYNKCMKTILYL